METDWASFSDGTTDNEDGMEDINEDENFCSYASGDIPKLQFRKDISKAKWIDKMGMAEILERKGRLWTTTGMIRYGKLYCSIEETLYLAEIGALHLLDNDDAAISLKDIYNKVAEAKNGCSWEAFEAYRHLKCLGYIVRRHGIPWTVKRSKMSTIADQDIAEVDSTESEDGHLISEMFSSMSIDELKPVFDVYPPNAKFRKSSPGDPCFVLCFTRGSPPSKQGIEDVERRCNGSPVKLCNVEHGRVSFFTFNRVELPTLP
nr:uncharacterized protein LOC109181459 isoform X2 [Ipomoea trifida]GMD39815.1 tRNA-splicing endonuclease subunit Sen54-like isoform X1 [Ipomoea batatas]GME18379.1 tRNA-splicing endonuclease subunit Sen54-like isoform X1 [Ipomoea batatas]